MSAFFNQASHLSGPQRKIFHSRLVNVMLLTLLLLASTLRASHQRSALSKKNLRLDVVTQEHLRDPFVDVTARGPIGGARLTAARETEDSDFEPPSTRAREPTSAAAPRPSVYGAGARRGDIGVVLVDSPLAAQPVRRQSAAARGQQRPPQPRGDTVVRLLGRTSGGIQGALPQLPRRVGEAAPRVVETRSKATSSGQQRPQVSYDVDDGDGNTHFHTERRDDDGTVRGRYGYRNSNGLYRIVEYEAGGPEGYRATVRTNEPGVGRRGPAGVDMVVEPPPPEVVARFAAGGEQGRQGMTSRPRPQTSSRPRMTDRPRTSVTPQRPASPFRQSQPPRQQTSGFGGGGAVQRQTISAQRQPAISNSLTGARSPPQAFPQTSQRAPSDDWVDKPKFVRPDKEQGHHLGLLHGALTGQNVHLQTHTGGNGKCRCEED